MTTWSGTLVPESFQTWWRLLALACLVLQGFLASLHILNAVKNKEALLAL